MRIDKFLKDSRIIKRRTIAKQACDAGRVLKMTGPPKPATRCRRGCDHRALWRPGPAF